MSRDLDDDNYYISHGGKIPIKWTSPEVGVHVCRYTYNACMCVYVLASWQLLTLALSSVVVHTQYPDRVQGHDMSALQWPNHAGNTAPFPGLHLLQFPALWRGKHVRFGDGCVIKLVVRR